MPRAPEVSSTEGVYVAATKARPATEEPVKRTAAKSPASSPAKRSPAKAANGAATKTAAKAPAKAAKAAATATKTRTATKSAAAKSAPARGRPKKATSKGADDAEATTTDVETDEQDLEVDAELDGGPGDDIEIDPEDLNLEDLEVDATDDDSETPETDGAAAKKPAKAVVDPAPADEEEIVEPSEKDKASGDFVWDEDESEALRQARKDAELTASADSVRAYLKQIGKVALLNAEEEVELAKRIEAGPLRDPADDRARPRRARSCPPRSVATWCGSAATATARKTICWKPTCDSSFRWPSATPAAAWRSST